MALRLRPNFLPEFACKRGDCRRTCCGGDWTIGLTRKEYDADRSNELGEECRALAERGLRPNPESAGDKDYAYCLMREDGFCVLLTEDKVCGWQKLRDESVGAACNDFPRSYCRFLDDEYVLPTMACEAVAESLLAKPDPVRLVGDSDPPRRHGFHVEIDQQGVDRRPLLRLYPELTGWGLALLQDRRFSLDDRFVLLANAMSLVDWTERSGRVDDLPGAMDRFLRAEHLQQVVDRYDEYPVGPKAFLAVNVNAFVRFMALPRFRERARQALEGLGIEVVETEDGRVRFGQEPVDSEVFLERKAKLAGRERRSWNTSWRASTWQYDARHRAGRVGWLPALQRLLRPAEGHPVWLLRLSPGGRRDGGRDRAGSPDVRPRPRRERTHPRAPEGDSAHGRGFDGRAGEGIVVEDPLAPAVPTTAPPVMSVKPGKQQNILFSC